MLALKITHRSRTIKSGTDLLQYTARYWAELIEEIESEGYKVDSADKHRPSQWITAYKNGNEYEIEVSKYSDGTYEIVKADIVGSVGTSTKTKVTASWDEDDSEWIKLNRKPVLDSDGFYTDYTLYTNGHEYICMFGDEDLYGPDPDYADFSTDSEEEAMEWFDSYEGFEDEEDDDIYDDIYDICSSEEVDDELEHPDQEYDSAATSINSNKLPAIYKMVNFEPGKVYLDFGGGKFDNGVYFVKDKGATLLVYDPYNRSDEHNKQVLAELKENGGADAGLNSNVLNVIKEPEARLAVLRNLKRMVKPGGDIYITVYEGSGKGNEGPTKAGYQLNRKTEGYMDEVRQIFPDAQRRGKLIHAVNSSTQPITITSGTVTDKVYWYFTRHGVQPGSIPKSIDTLYDVIDTPEGTYFATNTILNTKELSEYEIKEKWLPEKFKDQTNYFEHDRVVSATDSRVVTDDQYLTYCPNCHGHRFNDRTGLCLDCGYDEKLWGTGPYYDDDYDDDLDYEPSQDDWNELYDVSSSDYQIMKKSYKNSRKFTSQGDAEYLDFIDELDHKGVAHDQYGNIKDGGCTVFYDEPETPIVSCADETVEYLGPYHDQDREKACNDLKPVDSANDIGYSSFQDPRLQPPEYDEPEEESTEELIEFSFDEIVSVDSDGYWEYEDKSYNFARNPDRYDGHWYTVDFNVYFRDVTGVVEDMDSVLEKNMPMQAGRYRITGDANLYYNVSGIQVYTHYYGPDDYDQNIVQDGVDVEFNYGKSYIDNLIVQKLD